MKALLTGTLSRWSGVALLLCASLPAAASAQTQPQAIWRHHQVSFHYFGVTSAYSCTGLMDKMRQLLLYLGARSDLKITPSGCASLDRPTRSIIIGLDYYSLATAGADSSAASAGSMDNAGSTGSAGSTGAVAAHWVNFTLMPHRPMFMDAGECELVAQVKHLLSTTFTTRQLRYRTSCSPHQVGIADYSVSGQILKPQRRQR